MNSFRAIRTVCLVVVGLLVPTAAVRAEEPTIAWDGQQGTNPSSPAARKIFGSGTFTLPTDYLLVEVRFKYRLTGQVNYASVQANTNVNVNPKAWSKTVEGLSPGTYYVHAVLVTKRLENGNWVQYETPTPDRTVVVHDVEEGGGS
jgi:hypothetical protein